MEVGLERENGFKQERSKQKTAKHCVCGGGAGAVQRVGEGAWSYSIVPVGREWVLSKYFNKHAIVSMGFLLFFLEKWCTNMLEDNFSCKLYLTLTGLSPQRNLRQPLWICPLASQGDFQVVFSPSVTISHNWQLQAWCIICLSVHFLSGGQLTILGIYFLLHYLEEILSVGVWHNFRGNLCLLAKGKCELRPHFLERPWRWYFTEQQVRKQSRVRSGKWFV